MATRSSITRTRRDSKGDATARPADAEAEAKLALLEELLPQIARAVGPICEIVLHEPAEDQWRIRAIANGHISNRKAGGPMGRIYIDGEELHRFDRPTFNYPGRTHDGKSLRCSLLPVQHDNETIGLVCVNFLTHDLLIARETIGALLRTEPQTANVSEYVPSEPDLFEDIVQECISGRGRSAELLTREERLALLGELKTRGALSLRGAVDRLAVRLGTSRTTIYNDLKEIP